MPSLQILKGPNEGSIIPLQGERFILGRGPNCAVLIPGNGVSRSHAQILRVNGKFFIEDMQSRNGTFVNDRAIGERTPLKHNDKVRICDFIAAFLDAAPSPGADGDDNEPEGDEEDKQGSLAEGVFAPQFRSVDSSAPPDEGWLLSECEHLARCLSRGHLCCDYGPEHYLLVWAAVATPAYPGHASLAGGFHRVVCFDVRQAVAPRGAFHLEDFNRHAVERLAEAFGLRLDRRAEPEDVFQILRDEPRSLLCFLGAECIPQQALYRIRSFTQDRHAALLLRRRQTGPGPRSQQDALVGQLERLQRDLQLAGKVQRALLPPRPPSAPGYEFFSSYEAARQVSSDYYGYIPLADGRICVAVGDAAGKGVAAGLVMVALSRDLRCCVLTENDPGRAIARLNDSVWELTSQVDRFVTLCAVVLDPRSHACTLVCAGHTPPLLWRPARGELVGSAPGGFGGPPLGMIEAVDFETHSVTLEPGESMVLLTDGVTGSMNVQGEEFGHDGVERVIRAAGDAPPGELGQKLVAAVKQHAAGRELADDFTVVVIGRRN